LCPEPVWLLSSLASTYRYCNEYTCRGQSVSFNRCTSESLMFSFVLNSN
jgi:hypothetical protein